MAKVVRIVPPVPQADRGTFCRISTDGPGERVLYCNGSNVIWRSLAPLLDSKGGEKPEDIFCWKGHARKTTCAAMTPNSQWVVSGDIGGAIRVWGAKGEHVQKNEYKLWDGVVKDVGWSADSTRIVAAGDGKETRAVALIWDTGSKTGDVGGHTKVVNSVSIRSQRPFRVVSGGDDMGVNFHAGPPFKYTKGHTAHSNFVNCVRFSPDGAWALSAGSDSKLCLYEGKEGELVTEFAKPDGISGSLWDAAWSPDSAYVATAGGDRKLRIWGREAGNQVAEALVGSGALDDMQVGVAWPAAGRIVSVCLDGRLLLWDVGAGGVVSLAAAVDGTQGPITCLAWDGASDALVHGGSEGALAVTGPERYPLRVKFGKGVQHVVAHSSARSGEGVAWVFALDNCARRVVPATGEVLGDPLEIKEFVVGAAWLDVQETKLAVVTGERNLLCLGEDGVTWTKKGLVPRRPTAFACLPGAAGARLAVALEKPEGSVGGVESSQFEVHLFGANAASADSVAPQAVLEGHNGEVCALKFSHSGEFLASGDAKNKILVWGLNGEGAPKVVISDWALHTARVTCLDWLPDGKRLVSGSLDRYIYVWDTGAPSKRVTITEAHKGGVTAVAACGEGRFASVGHDGFLLVHQVE
mmetsp:Transcript_41038/g.112995  ORF Transcript_41038/g.112995 Transcript_41038/m.112995 type:complete len:638 (+) Transcript_41038:89-2002(+)|eukprot:CAMPEP_0117537254 /NCGR_PEP_ID=MMETSP0784-20121206/41869_1 /TAXON_ID=39447 /ORGANISM="" /LENGTH=637 /DNA_ID=CAMNT_0005333833 /DNA_START=38 /DNA_END=1951 /DNA_ORIENTATION=+